MIGTLLGMAGLSEGLVRFKSSDIHLILIMILLFALLSISSDKGHLDMGYPVINLIWDGVDSCLIGLMLSISSGVGLIRV
jgi:hypothetical protein